MSHFTTDESSKKVGGDYLSRPDNHNQLVKQLKIITQIAFSHTKRKNTTFFTPQALTLHHRVGLCTYFSHPDKVFPPESSLVGGWWGGWFCLTLRITGTGVELHESCKADCNCPQARYTALWLSPTCDVTKATQTLRSHWLYGNVVSDISLADTIPMFCLAFALARFVKSVAILFFDFCRMFCIICYLFQGSTRHPPLQLRAVITR